MVKISLCVGCGLTVDNTGLLRVGICPTGGIACFLSGAEGDCPDGGLAVKLCSTGGIQYDAACTDQFGNAGGLKVNFPANAGPIFPPNGAPTQLACGITTDGTGKLLVDVGNAATCGTDVENLLECIDGDGLRADHQKSIAGISLQCISPSFAGQFGVTRDSNDLPIDFHSETFDIRPQCNTAGFVWFGTTSIDVGGLIIETDADSRAVIELSVSSDIPANPINFFNTNPQQIVIADNRGINATRHTSVLMHDTQWTNLDFTGRRFQGRLTFRVTHGTARLLQGSTQNWEVNWHYSHAGSTNCTKA